MCFSCAGLRFRYNPPPQGMGMHASEDQSSLHASDGTQSDRIAASRGCRDLLALDGIFGSRQYRPPISILRFWLRNSSAFLFNWTGARVVAI
jgi:hypothetical protein